jgi:hypothetical protein
LFVITSYYDNFSLPCQMPEMYVATRKLAGNGDERKTDSGGKKKGKKKEAPNNTPPNPAQQKRTKDDWEKREREIKENTKNTKYKRKSG